MLEWKSRYIRMSLHEEGRCAAALRSLGEKKRKGQCPLRSFACMQATEGAALLSARVCDRDVWGGPPLRTLACKQEKEWMPFMNC